MHTVLILLGLTQRHEMGLKSIRLMFLFLPIWMFEGFWILCEKSLPGFQNQTPWHDVKFKKRTSVCSKFKNFLHLDSMEDWKRRKESKSSYWLRSSKSLCMFQISWTFPLLCNVSFMTQHALRRCSFFTKL